MEYIDVRVRIPVVKLGSFVLLLPYWAEMVGYDKLKSNPKPVQAESNPVPQEVKPKPHKHNDKYVPRTGSVVDVVLKHMIEKSPLQRNEVFQALRGKHDEHALSSAFQQLRNRGLIQQQTDGSYVVKS